MVHRTLTCGVNSLACALAARIVIYCFAAIAVPPAMADQATPADTTQNTVGKDERVSALSIILKVESIDGATIFQADGYRIKVSVPGTTISFTEPFKSLSDASAGAWMRFEGVRDQSGIVIARTAEFFAPGTRKGLTFMGPRKVRDTSDYQPVTRDSILDANGHFANAHTKLRYSDAGGPCGWHRVPADKALQERVERIGMRLVPAYQKQLAHDVPARISFRFYAVADDKVRSVFACNAGLVLVPKNAVERLKSDDQLAAVLADGIAFNLIRQQFNFTATEGATLSAEVIAEFAAGAAGLWSADVAGMVVEHEEMLKFERECARIALQLIDDAGYDPWQAPEAWRLLAPKKLPANPQSLKYTREGKYQSSILNAQYKKAGDLAH